MTIQTGQQILAADMLNLGGYAAQVNVQTLSATKTLVNADKHHQILDPGGAGRTITLPAEGTGNHPFVIINTADADELLTVQNDAAAIIGVVPKGKTVEFVSDGTNWFRKDGAKPRIARVTSTFNKTSDTTAENIPGLSHVLLSGRIYRFSAILFVGAHASGGVKVRTGGTVTATSVQVHAFMVGSDTFMASARVNSLGTLKGVTAAVQFVQINGYINVNAGGTLTIQFAQNASYATESSVVTGSWFEVEDIT